MRHGQISPGSALAIPYEFPLGVQVTAKVTCEQPVTTSFVDMDGKAAWESGGTPTTQGGFPRRRDHVFTMRLPPRNVWYLLIENPNPETVQVQYDVLAETYGPTGPVGPTGGWTGRGA